MVEQKKGPKHFFPENFKYAYHKLFAIFQTCSPSTIQLKTLRLHKIQRKTKRANMKMCKRKKQISNESLAFVK